MTFVRITIGLSLIALLGAMVRAQSAGDAAAADMYHSVLVIGLRQGGSVYVALDVTDPEPLPRDHPLLSLQNLVIAPHLGSAAHKTRHRMLTMTVENLAAGLAGLALPYQVHSN